MFDLRSTPVVASPSIVPDETLDRAHLFRMTLGDHSLEGEVLRLFDGPIYGARSRVMLDMIDAAALLWRLHLRGVDVGDRWNIVADAFAPVAGSGNYAFNDMHAAMAFVGARRRDSLEEVLAAQREAMARAAGARPSRGRVR